MSAASDGASSSWVQQAACGGIAAAVGKTATAPLERMRLMQQVGNSRGYLPASLPVSFSSFRVLWQGNLFNVMRVVPVYSIRFVVYEQLRGSAHTNNSNSLHVNFLCGSLAGFLSTLMAYPLDVIRTRLSLGTTLKQSLISSGGRGLYTGLTINLIEIMPYVGIYMSTYDLCRRVHEKGRLVSGLIAGFASTCICFPLDTLRRNAMVLQRPAALSMNTLARTLYNNGGIRRFYKGLPVALVKSVPASAITLAMNDWLLANFKS